MEVGPHHLVRRQVGAQSLPGEPEQRERGVVVRDGTERRLHARREREEPQHGPRDDTQRAFAADEELLQVVACVVLQHVVHRVDDGAVRQHDLDAEDQAAHHSVTQYAIPAGIGGDVATDGARPSRADVQWEQQPRIGGRFLDRLQNGAGFGQDRRRVAVDGADGAHAFERQNDPAIARHRAPGKPGPAALRHDGHATRVADAERGGHLARR